MFDRLLAGWEGEMVHVSCRRCARRGRYRKQTLVGRYGKSIPLSALVQRIAEGCRAGRACGAHLLAKAPPDFAKILTLPVRQRSVTAGDLRRILERHPASIPIVVEDASGRHALVRGAAIGAIRNGARPTRDDRVAILLKVE